MTKSLTTPEFWASYDRLPPDVKHRARAAFHLWRANPRHPSLCFKKVREVWSVRLASGYRALAWFQDNTFYWFWIGTHDEYERLLAGL